MNPKRQLRRLRDDDRWTGLPPTTRARSPLASGSASSRPRRTSFATGVAFAVAGLVAVGLWAGLSGLHAAQPAAPQPLPSSTSRPKDIAVPCTDAKRLAPIGCATYTASAAAGVPGGTKTWAGTTPPTFTLRVLNGEVTALVGTGCNSLTIPVRVSPDELTPTSGVASTLALCTGARSAQERWVRALFAGTVAYTLDGSGLRLVAGQRALDLTVTPAVVPTTSPTSRAPLPSDSPSKTAGCAATAAATPAGAYTAPIADVDGDGRADTEWAVQASGGTLQFGITTASGATIAGSEGFAGGGDRSFVVGELANGVVVAITSEGRDSPVYTFSGCRFHALRGKDLLPGTDAGSPFTLYSDESGGAGGCYDGRLALVHLTTTPGSPNNDDERAIARWIDVSADGLHATLTNETTTVASNLNIDTDRTRYLHYTGISCGASAVLRPIFHAK